MSLFIQVELHDFPGEQWRALSPFNKARERKPVGVPWLARCHPVSMSHTQL